MRVFGVENQVVLALFVKLKVAGVDVVFCAVVDVACFEEAELGGWADKFFAFWGWLVGWRIDDDPSVLDLAIVEYFDPKLFLLLV